MGTWRNTCITLPSTSLKGFYPFKYLPTQMPQLGYNNFARDSIKSLDKVEINDIHCSPLVNITSHFTIEGN